MQTYISDSRNEDKIYRIKQALLNLDRWDFSEGPIEVPACGYVEPFPGQDYTLWGCLDFSQQWYIRPAKKINLINYSNIVQSRTRKYRRRTSLGRLYTLHHNQDYPGLEPYIERLAKEIQVKDEAIFNSQKQAYNLAMQVQNQKALIKQLEETQVYLYKTHDADKAEIEALKEQLRFSYDGQ